LEVAVGRVQRRLEDVREVYAGRPGSTDDAIDDVQSFFEVVHHLRDWLGNDPSSGVTFPDATVVIEGSDVLRICGDLANGSKHFKLDPKRRPWTDDPSTTIARNDVAVTPAPATGSGSVGMDPTIPMVPAATATSAHRFYVASGGTEYDVLELAEAAVAEWKKFLSDRGLIS
jgi:hypothetical protein